MYERYKSCLSRLKVHMKWDQFFNILKVQHFQDTIPNDVKNIWNNSYIWTAVVDQSDEWSSQKIFQFKQLERRSLKKSRLQIGKFSAMIIPYFDLQPQFKYMNYFMYTSHHFTPHGRYELNKLASLPMCGFIAELRRPEGPPSGAP